jgi:hypothetical protein
VCDEEEVHTAFAVFDRDGSGTIDRGEVSGSVKWHRTLGRLRRWRRGGVCRSVMADGVHLAYHVGALDGGGAGDAAG